MNRILSIPFAFGIVIFSFLCSLFIAGIFSALDPAILSGTDLGIFSYLALFFAQIFLVVPIAFIASTTSDNEVPASKTNALAVSAPAFISVSCVV